MYSYTYLENEWSKGFEKFIKDNKSNNIKYSQQWHELSYNSNITWDIIQDNPDKKWNWEYISSNPIITWENYTR